MNADTSNSCLPSKSVYTQYVTIHFDVREYERKKSCWEWNQRFKSSHEDDQT